MTDYTRITLQLHENTFSFLDLVPTCVHPIYVEAGNGNKKALHKHLALQTYLIWYFILHPKGSMNFYIHEEDVEVFMKNTKECVQE